MTMRLASVMALLSCALAATLALVNGFAAFAFFITAMLASYVAIAAIRAPKADPTVFSGLFGLAIAALYSALYLWVWQYEFGLISDAELYDQLAQEIAASVPWYEQINPLSFHYVNELGLRYGEIAQPGFFKVLALAYTLASALGIGSPSIQIPLIINVSAFSLTGIIFYRLLKIARTPARYKWLLWVAFMTVPYFLEQLVWIRKDILLLFVSILALERIATRHSVFALCLIGVVATIRLWQALLLLLAFAIFEAFRYSSSSREAFNRHKIAILIAVALVVTAFFQTWELEIAPESLVALLADHEQATKGLSSFLLTNGFGAALYGLLYPFPTLLPKDVGALIDSAYAYLFIVLLALTFWRSLDNSRRLDAFECCIWISLVACFAGYALTSAISWKSLGFVVFESRFKLYGHALMTVVLGTLLGSRKLPSEYAIGRQA